ELPPERGVGHLLEGGGHVVLEEADVAIQLLDRDLGENLRRLGESRARLGKRGRYCSLARDESSQPLRRRRVVALHDHVGRVSNDPAVNVGTLRVRLDAPIANNVRVPRVNELLTLELLIE